MSDWQPISHNELADLLSVQLEDCTSEQRAMFEKHRVPFYKVSICRLGDIDQVFVLAEFQNGVIYYEDIEGGFEFDTLGPNGTILTQGCNQYELTHVLHRLESDSSVNRDTARPLP